MNKEVKSMGLSVAFQRTIKVALGQAVRPDGVARLHAWRPLNRRWAAEGGLEKNDLLVVPRQAEQSRGESRVMELDAVRGLAALGVVIFHFWPSVLPCGRAAVDLFFVLSGYLITAIILRSGSSEGFLTRFYARRGLRVWPIHYMSIVIIAAASPWLYSPCNWRGLWAMLTFTQNNTIFGTRPPPLFSIYMGHAWTLAIEEQFYLFWPALVLFVGRGRVVGLSLVCLISSILARSYLQISPMLLGGRADGLVLGGLLAALLARHSPEGPRRGLLVALFVTSTVISAFTLAAHGFLNDPDSWAVMARSPALSVLAFSTLCFGVVGLTICGSGRPALASLRMRPLSALGIMSFGLYLYHWPLILLANQVCNAWKLPGRPLWLDAILLVACFTVAWLSWIFIERPIFQLKDRIPYNRPRQRSMQRDTVSC